MVLLVAQEKPRCASEWADAFCFGCDIYIGTDCTDCMTARAYPAGCLPQGEVYVFFF